MFVGRRDFDDNVAGLTDSQILEVGTGCKTQGGAADACRAFSRLPGHGVDEVAAIIVAVYIIAQRGQIQCDGTAIFGGGQCACGQCRVVVDAGDSNLQRRGCGYGAVFVGCGVAQFKMSLLAQGQ